MSKKRCPRFWRMALLDLRAWVAAMFFVFGMMLAGYGVFFADAEDLAKAKGTNLDLWTGVGMIVFAVSFAVWLLARPPEFEIVPDAESLAGAAEGEANEAEEDDEGKVLSGVAKEIADGVDAAKGVTGLAAEGPGAKDDAV